MADNKLAALEHLGLVQNETLRLVVDHVRALALINTALIAALNGEARATVRQVALAGLGEGPGHERAAALIEAFTGDPAAALADHQVALSDLPERLQ